MMARFAIPRLPTPSATRAPGFKRAANPEAASWRLTSAATSGRARSGKCCRTASKRGNGIVGCPFPSIIMGLARTDQRAAITVGLSGPGGAGVAGVSAGAFAAADRRRLPEHHPRAALWAALGLGADVLRRGVSSAYHDLVVHARPERAF